MKTTNVQCHTTDIVQPYLALLLQITPSELITPREGHSAVVFGSKPDFRVVVLYGGSMSWSSREVMSKTTLLLLGKYAISATDVSTLA